MRTRLILGLLICITLPLRSGAQSGKEAYYKAERQQALALFNAQKHLEALPLFEDLATQNPSDADVLYGLGTCLVDHAATLSDEEAADKERVRARGYLQRAKELGNNSPLLLNLLELIPPDGSIHHQDNAEVDKAVQAGEAAFAKRDYDEALKNYSRALELEPKNYAAALFVADAYFAKKDFAKAAEGYERAIQANPDIETAYRYEADMLTKQGDMEKARLRSIQAIVAEPYNNVTWRGLVQWANVNRVQLRPLHINTPSRSATDTGKGTELNIDANSSGGEMAHSLAVWITYQGVRDKWREEEFKRRFPQEKEYRHSLAEESDALSQAAKMLPTVSAEDLHDPNLALLKRLSDANMIEPYVLLNAADQGIAQDYVAYRKEHRHRLEEYLSQLFVPPVSAQP